MAKIFGVFFLVLILAFSAWAFFFARGETMTFLNSFRMDMSGFFSDSSSAERIQELTLRVKDLEFALHESKATSTLEGRYHYKVAKVYSEYPYNDGGTFVMNAGSADGIKIGMPVMASEGVLLGKVISTKRTQALVETIFSPDWKSSVGIGGENIKAVVAGGITPTLDLIPKESKIKDGDEVVNLSPDYPMHAYLGTALHAKAVPNDVWQKAELTPPFRFEGLDSVLVIIDFP